MSFGIQGLSSASFNPASSLMSSTKTKAAEPGSGKAGDAEARKQFDAFVGEVFFGQMIKSMRETVSKPAYFHGGRGEEVFTEQLDKVLTEHMTKASAHEFTGPMYELFSLNRS
jgi:Rod binding domain-containing protein